jgi:hypothetical protein
MAPVASGEHFSSLISLSSAFTVQLTGLCLVHAITSRECAMTWELSSPQAKRVSLDKDGYVINAIDIGNSGSILERL